MPEQENSRDVKIFVGAAIVLAIVVFFGMSWLLRHPETPIPSEGRPPDSDRQLQHFVLTERSGATVSRDALSNKFLVVNFIHTGCSVSCEQVNRRMSELQTIVQDQTDVQLLSLTVDPRSDSPPALAKFADRFKADAQKWIFLTGDKEPVYDLIETSFLTRHTGGVVSPETGGFLDTDRIALVDKAGKVRLYFNGLQSTAPQSIAEAIEKLRTESGS